MGYITIFTERISIHALREEGDHLNLYNPDNFPEFLSTPSARRATRQKQRRPKSEQFLSTPSARRATRWRKCKTSC